jgi:hypothetical protein
MPDNIIIRHVGRGEITDPGLVEHLEELEVQADRDIQAINVNFRWGR